MLLVLTELLLTVDVEVLVDVLVVELVVLTVDVLLEDELVSTSVLLSYVVCACDAVINMMQTMAVNVLFMAPALVIMYRF